MRDLSPRTPPGLLERGLHLAGRTEQARRLREVRLRPRRNWLEGVDTVHLNGPQAVTLLRYIPGPLRHVDTYVHAGDLGVGDLDRRDRALLLAATDRFLAADREVARRLVDAGVAPDAVTVWVWQRPMSVAEPDADVIAEQRRRLGVPAAAQVVAVPVVQGWVKSPDLTVALAWELERRRPTPPSHFYWYGGPFERALRWPIEHDLETAAVSTVHLDRQPWRADRPALAAADVVVLPSRDAGPPGRARHAARWGAPILCWSNHPDAAQVRAWGGDVVPFPDVSAMAERVLAWSADEPARRAFRDLLRAEMARESTATLRLLRLDEDPPARPAPVPT